MELIHDDVTLASERHQFSVNVLPPNPMFLNPPETIHRTWEADPQQGKSQVLTPSDVELQLLIEFPDTFQREIKSTRLYIDGKLVSENTASPFDRFQWQIQNISQSGTHTLRVEAQDTLDLTGTSLELPVEVVVNPAQSPQFTLPVSKFISNRSLLVVTGVLLAGMALALVLIVQERRNNQLFKKRPKGRSQQARDKLKKHLAGFFDSSQAKREPAKANPGSSSDTIPASARLVRLNEQEQPDPGGIILLVGTEVTFGSDPNRATQVIESPSVDGLHARLHQDEDKKFIIADLGSVAGTWVNFAPVNLHGARLEHGDLINIGRVTFRFELTNPIQNRRATVQVQNPDDTTQYRTGEPK